MATTKSTTKVSKNQVKSKKPKESVSTTEEGKKVSSIKSKKPQSKSHSSQKESHTISVSSSQSFLAFLTLLVVSGFLVGGLIASFNAYNSLLYRTASVEMNTNQQQQTLPATGRTNESKVSIPTPEQIAPTATTVGDKSTAQSTSPRVTTTPKVTVDTTDPQQPEGTTEFREGDYKVYQYPDGRIIIVW